MNRINEHSKNIDIDSIITRLNKIQNSNSTAGFPLVQQQIDGLCFCTRMVLSSQPMLLQLKPPVNICGDIHGQFKDFTNMISIIGDPSQRNYLFLGDYVDRGKKSLQCFCLLMAYKIKHPNNFFMLRGNHQCSQVNKIYGFYDECKRKFNIKVWKNICDTFEYLPIAAVVGDRIFCVHGGLSPQIKNIRDLNAVKRPYQPLKGSPICDMLWSDPSTLLEGWNQNVDRGVSFYFGPNIISSFLHKYDFDFICRSHQVVEEGYQFFNDRKLVTVFSAPNYCGDFQNLGAVIKVDSDMKCSVEQFASTNIAHMIKKPKRSITPIPKKKSAIIGVSPQKKKVSQQQQKMKQQSLKQNMQTFGGQKVEKKAIVKKPQRRVTNMHSVMQGQIKQLQLKVKQNTDPTDSINQSQLKWSPQKSNKQKSDLFYNRL